MSAFERFTVKAWESATGRKFSLRAWQQESGYRLFTRRGWTEFIRGLLGGGDEPAPEYEGPLDLVPGAVVAYSASRALSAAMLNAPLCSFYRPVDGGTDDFSLVDGEAPVAAIEAFRGYATLAAIENLSDLITFGGDVVNPEPGMGVSGVGIPDGTTIIDTAGFPTLQMSAAATATNAAAAVTITGEIAYTLVNDQSGNDFHVPNTADPPSFPQWIASGQGGKPEIKGSGNLIRDEGALPDFPNGAITMFMVCKGPSNVTFDDGENIAGEITGGTSAEITMNDADNSAGGDYAGELDNDTYYVLDAAWQFGSHSFRANGAALTEQSDYDFGEMLGAISDQNVNLFPASGGRLKEVIVYTTLLSDQNRTLIRENMATYYGITLAP